MQYLFSLGSFWGGQPPIIEVEGRFNFFGTLEIWEVTSEYILFIDQAIAWLNFQLMQPRLQGCITVKYKEESGHYFWTFYKADSSFEEEALRRIIADHFISGGIEPIFRAAKDKRKPIQSPGGLSQSLAEPLSAEECLLRKYQMHWYAQPDAVGRINSQPIVPFLSFTAPAIVGTTTAVIPKTTATSSSSSFSSPPASNPSNPFSFFSSQSTVGLSTPATAPLPDFFDEKTPMTHSSTTTSASSTGETRQTTTKADHHSEEKLTMKKIDNQPAVVSNVTKPFSP